MTSSDRQLLERAAFKQWAEDRGNDMAGTYDTERSRWVWLSPMTADLWEAWTASRQKALQDAAELADQMDHNGVMVAADIASAIRSLGGITSNEGERG